jgi:hypothetical protein
MPGHRPFIAAIVVGMAVGSLYPASASAEPNVMTCSLSRAGDAFQGSCEVPCLVNNLSIDIDGPKPGAACEAPSRHDPVTLRSNGENGQWLGTMEGKFPEDPNRFEILQGRNDGEGIAKTPFGWFAVRAATHKDDKFNLVIAANNQLPPTANDIRIVERALDLLSSEATWNRQDTRTCAPAPKTWSLFCALQQATTEISGGVHYRQPALQAVREEVDRVYDRVSKHRLMEYNNSSTTSLTDVRAVLLTAETNLKQRLR